MATVPSPQGALGREGSFQNESSEGHPSSHGWSGQEALHGGVMGNFLHQRGLAAYERMKSREPW